MAHRAETAKKLLILLEDAAKTADFQEVAEILKRMLQPWGFHTGESLDNFTGEDEVLLAEFWRTYLDLPRGVNILPRALPPFLLFLGASNEPTIPMVQELAEKQCGVVVRVCTDLLWVQDRQQKKFRSPVSIGGAGVILKFKS